VTASVLATLNNLGWLILDDLERQFIFEWPEASTRWMLEDRPRVSRGNAARSGRVDAVELILLVAHKLKLKVIAEGSSRSNNSIIFQALGCELGQGTCSPNVRLRQQDGFARRHSVLQAKVAGAQ